jgi:uncharacterized protein
MQGYRGSRVLITGASKGLGEEFAKQLAASGADVVLTARSLPELERLAIRLRATHKVLVDVLTADLSDGATPSRILEDLDRRGITVDLLINNAGLGFGGSMFSHTLDQEIKTIRVNTESLVALTYLFGERMSKRKRGGIINIASNASFQPVPYMATYGATKAFVLSFSEALAEELRNSNVKVMASCPGPTRTKFFDQSPSTTMTANDMDPASLVVRRTLEDYLRGKSVSYPGRFGVRLGIWATRFVPRAMVARIAASWSKKTGFAA